VHDMSKHVSRIDTRALDGLRGVAAVHVMTGHYWGVGCPGVEMSLFFLLSGFSLTLAYGREKEKDDNLLIKTVINTLKFYQNRIARIGPCHYLSNVVAFFFPSYFGSVYAKMEVQTRWIYILTFTNSWFTHLGVNNVAFNAPSWTVSTLMMMYIVFPWVIQPMRRLSDNSLSRGIVGLFYLQLMPILLTDDHRGWAYKNPFIRMPVFLLAS